MGLYAEEMVQISARDSGLTYGELFRGAGPQPVEH